MASVNSHHCFRLPALLVAVILVAAAAAVGADTDYDPLRPRPGATPDPLDLVIRHQDGERTCPVRVYRPHTTEPAPVVLFSHGLGGSAKGCAYLGNHWAARGYLAVFLQHPGSDDSVWKDVPRHRRMEAMRQAANVRTFLERVRDVSAALDQLERWNTLPSHPLQGRADLDHVGMSGHSFGARTTQAVSGQRFGRTRSLREPRIKAALALSPSAPRRGSPRRAFGNVTLPWMLMTGTKDIARIGHATLEDRLSVFPALPPGGKYELVLHGAEHSAFTERRLPGDTGPRKPHHHRAILALSTAFWDTWLRNDAAAAQWLSGKGPRSLLKPEDRWQTK